LRKIGDPRVMVWHSEPLSNVEDGAQKKNGIGPRQSFGSDEIILGSFMKSDHGHWTAWINNIESTEWNGQVV
jgi:hypothetical protein